MSRFLTLSSDSNFPDNTPSNFTCLFENSIHLNNDCEVGVSEVHYPCDYRYNLGDITLKLGSKKLLIKKTDDIKNYTSISDKFLFFKEKIEFFDILLKNYRVALQLKNSNDLKNEMSKIQYNFKTHIEDMYSLFEEDLDTFLDLNQLVEFSVFFESFYSRLRYTMRLLNNTFEEDYSFFLKFKVEIKNFSQKFEGIL